MIVWKYAVLGVLYPRVLHLLVFVLVQCNLACFTWKDTLEIQSLSLLLLLLSCHVAQCRVVGAPQVTFLNVHLSPSVSIHGSSLGMAGVLTSPLFDVVFPPLLLYTSLPAPSYCALYDGLGKPI